MLEINTARIVNTVEFKVSKEDIAQAKKAADDLQRHFKKLENPKIRFKTMKQNQRKALGQYDNSKTNTSPKNTSDLKQQRIAEKAAKAQAREAAKIAMRNETADIKFKSAGLQLRGIAGKYGIDPGKQYEALKFIQEQTEQFRKGIISSQRMNFTIRERITDLRREAALQAKITASTQQQALAQKAAKRQDYAGAAKDIKEKGLNLIGGGPGFIAATAGFAAGAALLGRVRETANDNLDLVRKSDSVKVNPNAVKALVQANRQRGIDSNVDTITDNFKDVRERLGESVTSSQLDPKSGKWKGGNGAVDGILNQFGWNKSQITQYQDNPLDFVQAVVNEGQRRGMSDASIGHLLEDLGNDMSYLVPVLKNNGEEFNTTLKHLVSSGQTLNDEQMKQTYAYGDLVTTMQALNNGFNQNLTSGFLEGFGNAGKDLASNTAALNETAKSLGFELGNLLSQITGFTKEISDDLSKFNGWMKDTFPSLFTDPDKPATQALYDNAVNGSANASADWIQDKIGVNTRDLGPYLYKESPPWLQSVWDFLGDGSGAAGNAYDNYSLNGGSLRDSAMSLTSGNAPAYNLAPVFNLNLEASVPLTIASDSSRLSDYIDFQARASQASFAQSLTLQMSSGQSSTGG